MFIILSNDNQKIKGQIKEFEQRNPIQYEYKKEIQLDIYLAIDKDVNTSELQVIQQSQLMAQDNKKEILQFLYYPNVNVNVNKQVIKQQLEAYDKVIENLYPHKKMLSLIADQQDQYLFKDYISKLKDQRIRSFIFYQDLRFIKSYSQEIDQYQQKLSEQEKNLSFSLPHYTDQHQLNVVDPTIKQTKPIQSVQQQFNTSKLNQALIIGSAYVGKTYIFNSIFGNNQFADNKFIQKTIPNKYILVDCPAMYYVDANQREQILAEYTDYFQKYKQYISNFFLVLKYERIDEMKKQLISLLTFFKPFLGMIAVIVNNYHQEISNKDEIQIKTFINLYGENQIQKIYYMKKNMAPKDFTTFVINSISQNPGIQLEDTFFEQITYKQVQQVTNELQDFFKDDLNTKQSNNSNQNNQQIFEKNGNQQKNGCDFSTKIEVEYSKITQMQQLLYEIKNLESQSKQQIGNKYGNACHNNDEDQNQQILSKIEENELIGKMINKLLEIRANNDLLIKQKLTSTMENKCHV